MSLVAGIDYSTHAIDVVLIDEDTLKPEWHRRELKGADAWERTRFVRAAVLGLRHLDYALAIGIEEPRGYGAGHLYRIQGAILAALHPQILVQPWIPSAWRKAVGLKGNASKAEVKDFAEWRAAHTGDYAIVADWPQDACDAYCIARATLGAIERVSDV
jgi:hypothetical protein